MDFQSELAAGIEAVRARLERNGKLKISESHKFNDRRAQYFVVVSGTNEVDFTLTHEFLTDLPNQKEYKLFLEDYAVGLEHRFEQPNPRDFYCRSGTAFNLEIFWPLNQVPNRAASYLRVNVEDIRTPTLIAKCAVLFGMETGELHNPFERQQMVVNSIRQAIDEQNITFYPKAAHPDQLQQIETWAMRGLPPSTTQSDLEQFVSGKVYWLGFKREGRDSKVWVADPWDAKYLGVEQAALRRTAQIQEARDVLKVDSEDFARPGKGLLLSSSKFEFEPASVLRSVFLSGDVQHLKEIRQLLDQIIPKNVTVVTPGELPSSSPVSTDIRSLIERSDYVIVNFGSERPNIYYELGMAQALKKNVILLVPKDNAGKFPFDVVSTLYISYDPQDLTGLKENLGKYIERFWGVPVSR